MRLTLLNALVLALTAAPAAAQEEGGRPNLLEPHAGLMFWTLIIFVLLLIVLSRFAFKPLVAAVEARERALEDAMEGARRDREAAAPSRAWPVSPRPLAASRPPR